jgi:hypothetical protein
VNAVVETEFFFEVKRQVLALGVFVTDDVVRTCHNAPGAPGA